MEEILSSIKRIIAEDGDTDGKPSGSRRDADKEARRKAMVAEMAREAGENGVSYVDEVLELTDEMPRAPRSAGDQPAAAPAAAQEPVAVAASAPASAVTIVSTESEQAARSSLAALSSMLVKPEAGENTLEGLVREMLRPMLKEWLDAHLPTLVEGMVAREIARITGRTL